ncbi:MAG: hypothetical protein AAF335_03240 [Bacteroidota bacterium]
MRHSPVSILNFLANHYESLKQLFEYAKTSRMIEEEKISQLGLKELRSKLINYKILRPAGEGKYRFEERYFDFFSFLASDFSLDLPAQLAKYKHSLTTLFAQLKESKETEEVHFIAQKIIAEVASFLVHLEENTLALIEEVDKLRNMRRLEMNYTEQVKKSVYLITHFLEPLNLILDQHEEAIIQLVRSMIQYAYDQYLEALDSHEGAPYELLHSHLLIVEEELQKHLNTLVDSLLPLLNQIKVGGPIIKGLKLFRDHYGKGEDARFEKFLPLLHDTNPRHSPVRYDLELAAENILEEFAKKAPLLIHSVEQRTDIWYFHESFYKKKLLESLPIENFFQWCLTTLAQEEKGAINFHKFFKMANLLFRNRFKTVSIPNKIKLQLADGSLTVPHLNIHKK